MTMRINLPQSKYKEGSRRSDYYRQLMERLRALPGVDSAAAISTLPLSGNYWGRTCADSDDFYDASELHTCSGDSSEPCTLDGQCSALGAQSDSGCQH